MPLTVGYCACVAAAVAFVVALEVGGAAPHDAPAGITGPGSLVGWAVPGTRLLSDLAGAVAVGAVLAATILLPRRQLWLRDRLLHIAGVAALVLALSACAGLVFHASELLGRPLTTTLRDGEAVLNAMRSMQGKALISQLLLALMVALGVRVKMGTDHPERRWARSIALLGAALSASALPTISGHAAVGDEQWLATSSVLVHAGAATLWVGGLVALAILVMAVPAGDGALLDPVEPVRRFSALALASFLAVAASGLVNAWVRLDELSALWNSDYGRLVLAKATALALLAPMGWAHRRHTIRTMTASAAAAESIAPRVPFLRLAGVEIVVMAATFGVAVGLAYTPPPNIDGSDGSAHSVGPDGMAGMDRVEMDMAETNDPSATPAYDLRVADLTSGSFAVLATVTSDRRASGARRPARRQGPSRGTWSRPLAP